MAQAVGRSGPGGPTRAARRGPLTLPLGDRSDQDRGAVTSPEPLNELIAVDGPRRHVVVRVALVGGAVACFALGVLFGFVPGIPGFVFHVVGLLLLGMASRRFARWLNRRESQLPLRYRRWIRKLLRRDVRDTQ